jgi:hypothetical protein
MTVNDNSPDVSGNVRVTIPEVAFPSPDGAGKAADAKAVYDELENVVSVKRSQSFSDDDKERASVNGGYRYLLHVPESELETVDGEECLKYSVKDYAINIITLDTSSRVRIHLPAPVDKSGRCRDFVIKLKITSDPLPTIEFVKSDEDKSIGFESSDEEWATIEPGINYFTFTETERNA